MMKKYKIKKGTEVIELNCGAVLVHDETGYCGFDKNCEIEGVIFDELINFASAGKYKYLMELTDETIELSEISEFVEEVKVGYYNHYRLNKPEHDGDYWYIDDRGDVYRTNWYDDERDNHRWNNSNCYDSEETAETFKKNNERFAPLVKKMEIEFAKCGEIDWISEKYKYIISYSKEYDGLVRTERVYIDDGVLCSMSYDIVENFIEQNEEELKAYFKWMQEYNSWKGEK